VKKVIGFVTLFLLFSGSSFAATECAVWLGTRDVLKDDGSAHIWVIDAIITGTLKNIPCYD